MSTKGKWEPFYSIMYLFHWSEILIKMPLFISNLYLEKLFGPFNRASSPFNSLLVPHRNKMRINDQVGSTLLHLYWSLDHTYCLSSCLKIFSSRHFFRSNLLPLDLRWCILYAYNAVLSTKLTVLFCQMRRARQLANVLKETEHDCMVTTISQVENSRN